MFQTALFPDDLVKLGHYLGPRIDISPAMTTKVLNENGQVLHRSTYRPLTPNELLDKDGTKTQEQFMATVYDRLGFQILPRDLEDIRLENTLKYDPYEDDMQNNQTFSQPAEELEPMPEVGDQYVEAEIMLPRGDEMATGHVVAQSCNTSRTIMSRVHANPILDTKLYQVECTGGRLQNKHPIPLLSQCMPNEMQMGMSIYSWMHWLIILKIIRPFS